MAEAILESTKKCLPNCASFFNEDYPRIKRELTAKPALKSQFTINSLLFEVDAETVKMLT